MHSNPWNNFKSLDFHNVMLQFTKLQYKLGLDYAKLAILEITSVVLTHNNIHLLSYLFYFIFTTQKQTSWKCIQKKIQKKHFRKSYFKNLTTQYYNLLALSLPEGDFMHLSQLLVDCKLLTDSCMM